MSKFVHISQLLGNSFTIHTFPPILHPKLSSFIIGLANSPKLPPRPSPLSSKSETTVVPVRCTRKYGKARRSAHLYKRKNAGIRPLPSSICEHVAIAEQSQMRYLRHIETLGRPWILWYVNLLKTIEASDSFSDPNQAKGQLSIDVCQSVPKT